MASSFTPLTVWHPGKTACPDALAGNPDAPAQSMTVSVPTDKTGWTGVVCGSCGQTLTADGS